MALSLCVSVWRKNEPTCTHFWHTQNQNYSEHQFSFPSQFLQEQRIKRFYLHSLKMHKRCFHCAVYREITNGHWMYSPQIMSSAQRVMWLKQLNGPFPACFSSFSTRMLACSFITSKKSIRMEKWNVGVNIFLRWRHLGPVLIDGGRHQREFKTGVIDTSLVIDLMITSVVWVDPMSLKI